MLELIGVDELTQWDVGRQVKVDKDIDMVHFSNRPYGYSKNVKVTDGVADVPDMFLTSCAPLHIWAYIGNFEKGYTKIEKIYEVKPKNRPEDYIYTPEEVKTWEKLQSEIGDLSNLETKAKENLVAAINEVGSIQPDWNQNDETKKDYIKNRTHWVEEKTILEETTFTIEESADSFAFGNFPVTLSAGDICNVMYDGEAYTGTPYVWEDSASINLGEFLVYFQNQPDGLCAITIYSYPGEHTISILQKVYHPIPDEYIPNWVASIDNIMQPDWNQNDETAKDYIKGRPGGYYGEITTTTLAIDAIKQDESDKLTDVHVYKDNFEYKSSIDVEIHCSSGTINRTLTKRQIPEYVLSEYNKDIYGNAHLIHASQPDTGEDLAMYYEGDWGSTYDIGWHVWAPSLPSGYLELNVTETKMGPVPFPSEFIPWEESPTATSVLYTAQSLTEEEQAQARANIGAGTSYTLPQATAESIGGVKADSAEAADTQPVRIGGDGKLYTAPGGTDISLGLTSAAVGQTIKVKAIDASGKPTAWEAADMPSGGSMRWQKIKEITLTEQTNDIVIGEDNNGVSVADYNPIAMKVEFYVPADNTQTSTNGQPWIYPSATNTNASIRAMGTIAAWKTTGRQNIEFFIGDINGIFAGGIVNAQLVLDPSNKPNTTVMNGVKLFINNTGDHWPVGTVVSLEVLSERA